MGYINIDVPPNVSEEMLTAVSNLFEVDGYELTNSGEHFKTFRIRFSDRDLDEARNKILEVARKHGGDEEIPF
ncbi:hypothetical protein [Erythrobacter sp. MTPC3]|uniref:hypothetical protein n=1 Tax=Erythrobacter sp. MTPC3 TaxID=3056564 RepID=UPI0036F218F5